MQNPGSSLTLAAHRPAVVWPFIGRNRALNRAEFL